MLAAAVLLGACASNPEQDTENAITNIHEQSSDDPPAIVTAIASPSLPSSPPPDIQAPPSFEVSIWTQLKKDFRLPLPKSSYLEEYLQAYANTAWALEVLLERGKPYIAWIAHEAKRQKVPAEIALLPAVESGFDPVAQSGGDAAGLWQFIPATGRRFGLTQDWWYDGRLDVVRSTEAAMEYLKYLHKRFDGDWLLALAAYNTGGGKIRAAMKANRRDGKPADFWHLQLPQETKDYVPRLLALRLIIENPKRYGITLPKIDSQPALGIANTRGQVDLGVAATLADVPTEAVYYMNPGFKQGITPPKGPHKIVLPVGHIARFEHEIDRLSPEQRIQRELHKIKSGETLSHIALRYKTTVSALRSVNGLKNDRVRAGSEIIIPSSQPRTKKYVLASGAGDKRWWHRIKQRERKVVHGVKQGDTLWDLARYYGVSVQQLASWNDISTKDYLQPGQKLVLHTR